MSQANLGELFFTRLTFSLQALHPAVSWDPTLGKLDLKLQKITIITLSPTI
jgi:hypothetical protein